ncbi:MAG: EAL domain-containing protein [Pseudomonadota bacterium]
MSQKKTETLCNLSSQAMAILGFQDQCWQVTWANAAMGLRLGRKTAVGTRLQDFWGDAPPVLDPSALNMIDTYITGIERMQPACDTAPAARWRFVPMPPTSRGPQQVAVFCEDCAVPTAEAEVAALPRAQDTVTREAEFDWLYLVAQSVTDGVVVLDHAGRIEWANAAYLSRTETTIDQVRGLVPEAVRPPEPPNDGAVLRPVAELDSSDGSVFKRCFRRKDGRCYWIELETAPLIDKRDGTLKTVVTGRDVTKQHEIEQRLIEARERAEKAEKRLWAAIEAVPAAFAIFDSEERLVAHNQLHLEYYWDSRAVIASGVKLSEILEYGLERGLYPNAVGREREWFEDRMKRHREASSELEQHLSNGRWLRIIERRTGFGDTVTFRVDITHLKENELRMNDYTAALEHANLELAEQTAALELSERTVRHNALHDALTGLANRRYLDECLRDLERQQIGNVALLHIDLDRFKQINDTLGHAAGDAVLEAVAERIRGNIRKHDFAARIGGDEFVVLCRSDNMRDELAKLAQRLITAMRKPVTFEQHSCRFGASIGVATVDPNETGLAHLLVQADVALYRAKNRGRNRFEFYSDALHAEIVARKRLSDELVAGIEAAEILPFYQPQICLRTGQLIGAEALARWRRSDGKTVAPDEFLQVASELDLVGALDRLVMGQAMADLRGWQSAGHGLSRVSVNVSSKRLSDPGLLNDLDMLDLQPGMLVFELLESIYLDKTDSQINWTIDALRERGIAIELDDFGSGYASILSLFNLKPDAIKIDRDLVEPIVRNEDALALVRSLTDIGKTLGVGVLAEGVETEAHVELLRQVGCSHAQGHLFGAPMPAEAFTAFLEHYGNQPIISAQGRTGT